MVRDEAVKMPTVRVYGDFYEHSRPSHVYELQVFFVLI